MSVKGWAITMGLGAAAGAVAILPKNNPTRMLADKAAGKVEDAAMKVGDKLSQKLDM